jgi:hypothetical protein
MPPLAILSSSIFFYLASQSKSTQNQRRGYIAAGVLGLLIVPYTVIFMNGTNGRLLEMEGDIRGVGVMEDVGLGKSAHELADWWAVLNLGRSVFLVGSLVVGAWSVVN